RSSLSGHARVQALPLAYRYRASPLPDKAVATARGTAASRSRESARPCRRTPRPAQQPPRTLASGARRRRHGPAELDMCESGSLATAQRAGALANEVAPQKSAPTALRSPPVLLFNLPRCRRQRHQRGAVSGPLLLMSRTTLAEQRGRAYRHATHGATLRLVAPAHQPHL